MKRKLVFRIILDGHEYISKPVEFTQPNMVYVRACELTTSIPTMKVYKMELPTGNFLIIGAELINRTKFFVEEVLDDAEL